MPVLSREDIVKAIDEGKIILHPCDKGNVREGSIDLRLGNTLGKFIPIHPLRDMAKIVDNAERLRKPVVEWVNVRTDYWELAPGDSVVGQTYEKVTLPKNVCGWLTGRGRLVILGLNLQISTGFISPDTTAENLFFLITNLSTTAVALHPMTKICQIVLQKMSR